MPSHTPKERKKRKLKITGAVASVIPRLAAKLKKKIMKRKRK